MDTAYLCFLLLGMGDLLPWNALITAADYWENKFPGKHTDRLVTAAYLPANLVLVSALVAAHGAVRPRLRITAGLLGFTLAMAAVVWMDAEAASSGAALAALLALVAACGACDGLASGALYGEAAVLAPRYTQALAAGNSMSGVAVSLLRAATKATLPGTPAGLRDSANLYFGLSAAACLGCTLLYLFVLPRLAAVRRRREAALAAGLHSYERLPFAEDGGGDSSGLAGAAGGGEAKVGSPARPRHPAAQQQHEGMDLELSADDLYAGPHASEQNHHHHHHHQQQQQQQTGPPEAEPLLGRRHQRQQQGASSGDGGLTAAAVLRRVWRVALANTLTFVITLSIFPGVLAEDLHSPSLGSWYPIALLGAYNLADWAGKSAPGWRRLRLRSERAILGATLARSLFIPAFRLAAVAQAAPPAVFALTLALGCTNGYTCASAMMAAPGLAPPAAAGLTGNLMVLAAVLGLCLGAAASFLWLLLPPA